MPVRLIAAKFGVHRGTIPSLVTRAGGSLRSTGLSETDHALAAALYVGGLTLQQVAEQLGVDDKTVRNAVLDAGCKLRPRGRRPVMAATPSRR